MKGESHIEVESSKNDLQNIIVEELVIGSCFGEDKYKSISFLEVNDFENQTWRRCYGLIVQTGAKENVLLECLKKTENEKLRVMLTSTTYVVACHRLATFAVYLVERRFKRLLEILLMELAGKSENDLEVSLLAEAYAEVGNQDIFNLSDNLLDYLGEQASPMTKNRIGDYLKYQAKRIKEVKSVLG